MQPETINSLRGTKHSEVSDLHKFVQYLKAWHLVHCPKIEFYFFLEKVQKLGKEKDVQNYLQKLRNHYKGEEVLEEFQNVFDLQPEEGAGDLQIDKPMGDAEEAPKPNRSKRVKF